ncbi:MAG: hypothetical protein A2017_08220 [Lentisphaerae bacterium GWF2_44_16]|nr:MAG: hypothetical protein A2017_08220 [Lentisphaerae bacterium GWF2_44_16]
MKSNIRLALIGAGSFAGTMHYPALSRMGDVELSAICDVNEEKLKSTGEKFGIKKTFTDYRKMLDEVKPDAVYVIMPPYLIFDVAADVIERKYPLFVEKPPAVTSMQAECLGRMALKNNVLTAVGFQRRYHPLVHACWQTFNGAQPVPHAVFSYYKCVSAEYPYYRGAMSILHCDAIHAIDAARYYCGLSELKNIKALVRKDDFWYQSSFEVLVEFENGNSAVLLIRWRSGRRFLEFEFNAPGKLAVIDTDGKGKVWADNNTAPVFSSNCSAIVKSDEYIIMSGIFAENRAFIDAVKNGNTLHNSIQDAAESMKLADEIYRCAENYTVNEVSKCS